MFTYMKHHQTLFQTAVPFCITTNNMQEFEFSASTPKYDNINFLRLLLLLLQGLLTIIRY